VQTEPPHRLTCPPIAIDDLLGTPATIDADAIRAVGALYAAAPSAFGLELKVAYALEAAGHGGDRLRRPYYRPAQEPFIWSWWSELQQVPLDPEAMLALASILNGKAAAYREMEMFSAGAPGAPGLRYETPERARRWLADIAAADAAEGDPVKQALYRFARIIIAHPFTDANGRFTRAALQASVARGGLIATPCLAPAPVFYLRAADIRSALAELSRSGDWQSYFERMGTVLAACVHWVEAISRDIPT
jgi:hypothetical protein